MTRIVRVSTELPLSADRAFKHACRLQMMEYVMRPLIVFAVSDEQRDHAAEQFPVGEQFEARLRLFGLIPLWKHRLTVVSVGGHELYTKEAGGPVRVWNHRLIFTPLGGDSCRYTDEIEVDGGVIGLFTALFVGIFFRHRQRRWRRVAALLAA